MSDKEKIGVGIITYNRPEGLKKLLDSISYCNFIDLIIINDGEPIDNLPGYNYYLENNETNLGVGKSKNKALKHLMDKGCDHFFLIEDDIYIKDEAVFQKYINASKVSGIQHFNFSQHGMMNKSWPDGKANPLLVIDYGSIKIPLYMATVGAFSYYSRLCIEQVGYMDERYYNACEHVDHTYEIIKKGMHPPFWYNADIENSWEYLGDETWSVEQSTISSKNNHQQIVSKADEIFFLKHGYVPRAVPFSKEDEVIQSIKKIKKQYGSDVSNL